MAARHQPQFTLDQHVFVVVNYWNTWSATETLRLFAMQYPNMRLPSRHTLKNDYNKYVQFAVSTNRDHGNSGRRRTARTQANIVLVRQALQANPNMTARWNTWPSGEPIQLQKNNQIWDFAFHPYRMERRQRLLDADFSRRLQYSQWLKGRQNMFWRDTLVGDKATFPMNGPCKMMAKVAHFVFTTHLL